MQSIEDVLDRYDTLDSLAEFRLFQQLHSFLEDYGGVTLPQLPIPPVRRVLDLACGAGHWVRSLATQYPQLPVLGIDKSPEIVAYAQAIKDGLHNAHFLCADIQHMNFSARIFDLIHARFLSPAIAPHVWHSLFNDCFRICRPGGSLIWTEATFPLTNSPALFQLCELIQAALREPYFTPNIAQNMEGLIQHTGWREVQKTEIVIDLSYGTSAYSMLRNNQMFFLSMIHPLLLHKRVVPAQQLASLCQEAIAHISQQDFTASWSFVTLTAKKLEL